MNVEPKDFNTLSTQIHETIIKFSDMLIKVLRIFDFNFWLQNLYEGTSDCSC